MKISAKSSAQVEKEFKDNPPRKQGQWTTLIKHVKDTGTAIEVTELTKGQIAGAVRRVKEEKLRYRAFYTAGRILILPAEGK